MAASVAPPVKRPESSHDPSQPLATGLRLDVSVLGTVLGLVDTVGARWLQLKGLVLPQLKFFRDGWGGRESISEAKTEFDTFVANYQAGQIPATDISLGPWQTISGGIVCNGSFPSPLASRLPERSRTCEFELVCPVGEPWAIVIQFPGTADQAYSFRRGTSAQPLLQQGVASLLLTPPFYGMRKPPQQWMHYISNVADFCNQSNALIAEALVLLDWLAERYPRALLGCTGLSWGGAMSIVLGTVAKRHDLAVAPFLPAGSPRVLVTGVLCHDISTSSLATESESTDQEAREELLEVLSSENAAELQKVVDVLPGRQGIKTAVQVSAHQDTIVPRSDSLDAFQGLQHLDPAAELLWIRGGHVSSFARARSVFVEPVLRSLRRLARELGREQQQTIPSRL